MYLKLDVNSVIDYAKKHYPDFKDSTNLTSKELSDGNINFVFRVVDTDNNHSVIIKQASKSFRTSPEQPLTDERIVFEINSLKKMDELAPGCAPKIYFYDEEMKCCLMEDCANYSVMRSKMQSFVIYPFFGKAVGEFLAKLHFHTSDFYLKGELKKALVKEYMNPELCEITERLVFTEPFTNYLNRNEYPEELKSLVEEEIYKNEELQRKAARLKYKFLTSAQALSHGDLHTGSIFINETDFKAFDSEFAFVGPCSYDIGCIIGNLVFALAAAEVVGGQEYFVRWVLSSIREILTVYKNCFLKLVCEKTNDPLLKDKNFANCFIEEVQRDAVATAGVEVLRRTITKFKVADITKLETEKQNTAAQRKCINIAKELILNPQNSLSNSFAGYDV